MKYGKQVLLQKLIFISQSSHPGHVSEVETRLVCGKKYQHPDSTGPSLNMLIFDFVWISVLSDDCRPQPVATATLQSS